MPRSACAVLVPKLDSAVMEACSYRHAGEVQVPMYQPMSDSRLHATT